MLNPPGGTLLWYVMECGRFRAIVLSISKIWLAQHPHKHFTFQNLRLTNGQPSVLLLTRKLDGGQVLEKPKKNQNKMDEKHENHYGMDGIGYRPLCPFLLPILEILAWPNSLRAPQIPKFEVDIWGNFYVVDQKA